MVIYISPRYLLLMKNLIRLIDEQLEGEGENPLSEKEIRFFKYINKNKDKHSKQGDLLKLFKSMMPIIGRPESDARFYYEIYTANYRPEGDYENLDKSTFKHYREFKQRRTPNNSAYEYSSVKLPFKGSSLEGYWDVNNNNEWYYVVTSYGWYPIYLYINNQWYRVSNSYSSSTAKHLSGANPIRRRTYDPNIKDDILYVTPEEIKNIMNGKSMEDIKSKRLRDAITTFNNYGLYSKMITIGWGNDRKKVKFTIKDVKEHNGKLLFNVRIDKAGTVEGTNRMVINPEGYVVPSPFSEDIENGIKQRLISDFSEVLKNDNTEFKFYHPNK